MINIYYANKRKYIYSNNDALTQWHWHENKGFHDPILLTNEGITFFQTRPFI